ncbi:MAG: YceD family protein, partial [Actinomycetia bacterium]|nr:YceD family protein [Actinomycetes bacterium]
FLLNVADLVGRDASSRPVVVAASVDWGIEMSAVDPKVEIVADLNLHPVSGGVAVTGAVTYTTLDTCFRCLDEFRTERRVTIGALFDTSDDDDESYPLVGHEIDVEQLLRDEVLLALPIVQECGKSGCTVVRSVQVDSETVTADDEGESRSPFAVLKDFLESED